MPSHVSWKKFQGSRDLSPPDMVFVTRFGEKTMPEDIQMPTSGGLFGVWMVDFGGPVIPFFEVWCLDVIRDWRDLQNGFWRPRKKLLQMASEFF